MGVALAAWLPNLVLGVLATTLLLRTLRERVVGHVFDSPRRRQRRWIPWRKAELRWRGPRRYALLRYVAGRFL